MGTNMAINETLLERAFHVNGLKTEGETVNLALEEVISLFNTVEYDKDYDYKKLRDKR
jgi:hypothetical protein